MVVWGEEDLFKLNLQTKSKAIKKSTLLIKGIKCKLLADLDISWSNKCKIDS